jgi:hypothetical protein
VSGTHSEKTVRASDGSTLEVNPGEFKTHGIDTLNKP